MGFVAVKSPSERKPGPEPAGRICSDPGCTTPLSTYNTGTECSVHGGWPQQSSPSDPVIALATARDGRRRRIIGEAIEELAA